MSRIGAAFRAFFRALSDGEFQQSVERLLAGEPPVAAAPAQPPTAPAEKPSPPKPPKPSRSEAVTLLATLQRDARFVDFVMEPLDDYSDEQVGAAVRDVHRDCGKALRRLFAIRAIAEAEEGTVVSVPPDEAGSRYLLTGNISGDATSTGTLMHAGWEAAEVKLPEWSGHAAAANVIAPAEVEICK